MAWHREQRARRGTSGNGARILNLKSMAKTRRAAAQPARKRVSTSDEQQLIQRILDGETDLFHELVRPCARMVFCVCQSVLRNRDDAEDAAQETMLKAFKNLGRFRAESKFSTWLVAIALNEARARLPDRRVTSFDSHEYLGREEEYRQRIAAPRDESATPLETLERKEVHRALRTALGSLPKSYRQVLLLRKAEELSTGKTAGLLGVSKGAVKVRLLRARLMMRKKMATQLQQRANWKFRGGIPCQTCGD
jgi:RNA polymerase sigma-70 factor (ECF subfamily)